MSQTFVKEVFSIIGYLLLGTLLFNLIFNSTGQQIFWNAIEPAMESQWENVTMDSGSVRTEKMVEMYKEVKGEDGFSGIEYNAVY